VLGIVLPTVTAPGPVSGAIAGIADIRLFELFTKLLLFIYVDIIVSAPSTVASTSSAHGCSNHHSNSKRNRHAAA